MSEHLSNTVIGRYRRQLLSPAELLAVDDHLFTCETCSRKLYAPEQLQEAYHSVRVNLQEAERERLEHPAGERFAAYVDDALGDIDREVVKGHLDICSSCASEVRELLMLRAALATEVDEKVDAAHTSRPVATRWQKFVASLRLPSGLTPFQAAGVAAAALLFVGAAVIIWLNRENNTSTPTEIVRVNPTPALVEPTPATLASTPSPDSTQPERNTNGANTSATPPIQSATPTQTRSPTVPAPRQVIIALDDGGSRITLDNAGHIEGLEELPPSYQQAVREALVAQRLAPSSALAGVGGPGGAMMGGSDKGVSFALLNPVGEVVRTDRPVFRWSPLEGASGYVVKIYDSNYQKVAGSPELQGTEWSVSQPLARGRIYRWEVTANKNGAQVTSPQPPAPEAKFKVLEQTAADELEEAQARYTQSHLTLGILYTRAGLLDDAEREFQALVSANPNSALARKLLRDVQARRQKRK
jgi:anti-sigma factor RsiW